MAPVASQAVVTLSGNGFGESLLAGGESAKTVTPDVAQMANDAIDHTVACHLEHGEFMTHLA
jgi:hypothetical protein